MDNLWVVNQTPKAHHNPHQQNANKSLPDAHQKLAQARAHQKPTWATTSIADAHQGHQNTKRDNEI